MCALLGIDSAAWSAGDWAQVLSAVFTALAAFAAWASVFRVERDRRRRGWPDPHVELLVDLRDQEVRLTVVNHGGPAREVSVFGVLGDYGFAGLVPPGSYWQPGERRVLRISMPPVTDAEVARVFVEARDMAKKYLFVGTHGGASHRWPLRKAKKLSAAKEWEKLFPGFPGPLDVRYTPMNLEVIERTL